MNAMAREIRETKAPDGGVALWWLAQAGFVFKSGRGTIVYVDAYLSHAVEKAFGFKRLSLAPIDAGEVRADWVVSSHEHLDHLDTDALPIIASNNPACSFAAPESCFSEYDKAGIPNQRRVVLEAGMSNTLGDIGILAARADHGELSPSALSLLFDFGDVRVLFTGDTAFNVPWMRPLIDKKPDILIPCINGRFGNMNAAEAAELSRIVRPRAVIPCHFWMFKEHNGDPQAFVEACGATCPEVPVHVLRPGEGLLCSKESMGVISLVS